MAAKTAKELLESAKCYKCIPRGRVKQVIIYLLCQWLKKKEPVIEPFSWEPASEKLTWTDMFGIHITDLATFYATADIGSVTDIFGSGVPITSLNNLDELPSIAKVEITQSNLTTISFQNCPNLNWINLDFGNISNVDIDNCPALLHVILSNNSLNTAQVNCILVQLDSNGLNGGVLALDAQTPPAPPDGSAGGCNGTLAKSDLLAVGRGPWTVSTD